MKVDFVRFKATDGVELRGWLSGNGNVAAVHVHGKSGNGYENYFLDNLRDMYSRFGISFFAIDTRGTGVKTDLRQGDGWKHAGSCFEIFEESVHDIEGAIHYLRSVGVGTSKLVLQGHSLGCSKVVNYCMTNGMAGLVALVLLAPTDMVGWAQTDRRHTEYLERATQLLVAGKGEELVGAQCWKIDETPISAQTYPTICETNTAVDIYGERENGALLGRITIPMLIIYGTDDVGITEIDGSIDKWQARMSRIKHPNTQIEILRNAPHSFRNYEKDVSWAVEKFVTSVI